MRKSTGVFLIGGLLGLIGAVLLAWMASGPAQSDPRQQAELMRRLGEVGGALVGIAVAIGVGGWIMRQRGR